MECYKCGRAVLTENSVFCDACGARLDGKKNCHKCNNLMSADSKFCNLCGTCCAIAEQELRTEPTASANSAASNKMFEKNSGEEVSYVTRPRRVSGASTMRYSSPKFWVEMCRNMLLLVFSVVIFSLSFGSVMTIKPQGIDSLGKTKVNVSAIDMVDAMFSLGTQDTVLDMLAEFQEVALSELSASTMNKVAAGEKLNSAEQRELDIALSKCNFLKLAAAADIRTLSPVTSHVSLIGMGLLALAVIVGSGVFMILALISIILSLVKMDFGRVNRGKWYAFAVPFLLVVSLVAFLGVGTEASLSGNAIMIMVLSLLGLGTIFSTKYVLNRENVQVKTMIGRLVSIGLAAAMLVTVSSSMMTANYTFKINDRELRVSHGLEAMSYIVAADMLVNIDDFSEMSSAQYVEMLQLIAESSTSGIGYKALLTKALESGTTPFNWFFISETQKFSAPSGWFFGTTPLFVLGLIGLCFLSIVFNTKNLYNNSKKKSNLLVNIFTIVAALGLFAYSLVAVLSINSIVSQLGSAASSMLTMTIGAGSILLLIFSIGNLVQSIILNPKAKVVYIDVENETV